jgi:hypothetical protein
LAENANCTEPGGDDALPLHRREMAPRGDLSGKRSCRQRAKWQGGSAHENRKVFLTKRFFVRQRNGNLRRLVNLKEMPPQPDNSVPSFERRLEVPEALASQRRPLMLTEITQYTAHMANAHCRITDFLTKRG